MAANAFLTFFEQADGESIQRGREHWVELQGWDWEIEAIAPDNFGGGEGIAKPVPGTLSCTHLFDRSSIVALGFIATGSSFAKVQLDMTRASGKATPETYFAMTMHRVFLTNVSQSGSADGVVSQRLQLAFESVTIDYHAQDRSGGLSSPVTFSWDIPAGTASPSA